MLKLMACGRRESPRTKESLVPSRNRERREQIHP